MPQPPWVPGASRASLDWSRPEPNCAGGPARPISTEEWVVTSRMAQEISEQPGVIERTLDVLLPKRDEVRRLAAGRRHLLLVGRGTSDNANLYGRYLLEIHSGRGATLAAPSLATHYAVERDLTDTLVLALSQSGETTEIVEMLAWAASRGARTAAITNNDNSTLTESADLTLVTAAGAELAVPATKSYTAQLTALAVVADALRHTPASLETDLRRVPDEVERLLANDAGVDAAVERLASRPTTLVIGRGLTYGTAQEVALKLEETCLRPVRGLSYADLRHGPIAVVDHSVTVVLIAAQNGPMTTGIADVARDAARLGAQTVSIGGNAELRLTSDIAVAGPDLPEAVAPLALIVPAQIMVEKLARALGRDPDAPRGLSKVTSTDPTT